MLEFPCVKRVAMVAGGYAVGLGGGSGPGIIPLAPLARWCNLEE